MEQAISDKEKILIYGDYDVDGTTAVSTVYLFFKRYYSELDFYTTDRYKEGYGISRQGIEWAAENGFSLIVAMDCGLKPNKQMDYYQSTTIHLYTFIHPPPP